MDASVVVEPKLKVGMLIFPNMTLLDMVGPQLALMWDAETYLVWETMDPVMSDSGVAVVPHMTMDECPENLDVLFVPGGVGAFEMVENEKVLAFLKKQAKTAKYITSVCTGAVLLAAVGLLDGYEAATHWATFNILEEFDEVKGKHERVVIDRNRITGGGVTAGIDFALALLAKLRGQDAAKISQLMMEYDPHPPVNSGHPRVAEPRIVDTVNGLLTDFNDHAMQLITTYKAQNLKAAA